MLESPALWRKRGVGKKTSVVENNVWGERNKEKSHKKSESLKGNVLAKQCPQTL